MSIKTRTGWVAALVLLAGCATTEPQRTELTRAELVIDQAQTEQAGQYAPTELREARAKLKEARGAFDQGDNERANELAREALVSAQLALAETQSGRVERLVEENQRGATLRQ